MPVASGLHSLAMAGSAGKVSAGAVVAAYGRPRSVVQHCSGPADVTSHCAVVLWDQSQPEDLAAVVAGVVAKKNCAMQGREPHRAGVQTSSGSEEAWEAEADLTVERPAAAIERTRRAQEGLAEWAEGTGYAADDQDGRAECVRQQSDQQSAVVGRSAGTRVCRLVSAAAAEVPVDDTARVALACASWDRSAFDRSCPRDRRPVRGGQFCSRMAMKVRGQSVRDPQKAEPGTARRLVADWQLDLGLRRGTC